MYVFFPRPPLPLNVPFRAQTLSSFLILRFPPSIRSIQDTCDVKCKTGYSGAPALMTCSESGTDAEWIGTAPHCQRMWAFNAKNKKEKGLGVVYVALQFKSKK